MRTIPFCYTLCLLGFLGFTATTVVDAGPLPITGQIIDENDRPLADVTVSLRPLPRPFDEALERLDLSTRPTAIASTVTTRDGRFHLDAPRIDLWRLEVTTPELGTVIVDFSPLLEPTILPPITLQHPRWVQARVVDSEGRPVMGAKLLATSDFMLGANRRATRQMRRVTDEHGHALVPSYGASSVGYVSGRAPANGGWLPLHGQLVVDQPSVRFEMSHHQVQTARLVRDGRPAAGALLVLAHIGPIARADHRGDIVLPFPNRGGAFRWTVLPDLTSPRVSIRLVRLEEEETPADGPMVFELPPRDVESGEGRVVDRSGSPVAGAFLWHGDDAFLNARTDRDGRFTLDMPSQARRHSPRLQKLGFRKTLLATDDGITVQRISSLDPSPLPDIVLGANDVAEAEPVAAAPIESTLGPRIRVTGLVVDPTGRPVVGVAVRPGTVDNETSSITDAAGRFHFAALTAPVYLLWVERPRALPYRFDLGDLIGSPITESRDDLRLKLPPSIRLEGSITVPAGNVGDVRVSTYCPVLAQRSVAGRADLVPDSDGRFVVDGLSPCIAWTVQATLGHRTEERELQIDGADDLVHADFVLEAGAEIAGHITLDGEPLSDASMIIRGEAGWMVATRTDHGGRFRALDVLPGPATLLIRNHRPNVEIELNEPLEVHLTTPN